MTSTSRGLAVLGLALWLGACRTADGPTNPVGVGGLAIDSTVPSAGAQAAAFHGAQSVYFDRALDPATVTTTAIGVLLPNGQAVPGRVAYDDASRAVHMDLAMVPGLDYTGVVSVGIRGGAGESLDSIFRWSFTARRPARVVIDATPSTGSSPAIASDAAGVIHVAYADSASGEARYARCAAGCTDAAGWTTATIGIGVGGESRLGLSVSAAGELAVAYYVSATGALGVSVCDAGCETAAGWQSVVLDDAAGDVGFSPSVARAPDGVLHVVFQDKGLRRVRYTQCAGGCGNAQNWLDAFELDTSGDLGRWISVAVAGDGRIHAAWTDEVGQLVVYAACTQACNEEASWLAAPLLGTSGATDRVQISVDDTNRPTIVFGIDQFAAAGVCVSVACGSDVVWGYVALLPDAAPDAALGVFTSSGTVKVAYATGQGTIRYLACTFLCEQSSLQWVGGTFDEDVGSIDGALSSLPDGTPILVARRVGEGLAFLQ